MKATTRAPVKFERPPVVEVVFSLTFKLATPLSAAHIGLFWADVQREFPNTEDAAPIVQVQERFDGDSIVDVTMTNLPPLRRSWFLAEDGRHLIQLQEDRFIYNWKRIDEGDDYPSYEKISAGFKAQFAKFVSFLRTQSLGEPGILQLELTYVNHIPAGPDTPAPTSLFIDHARVESGDRFLPRPEAFRWGTAYALPNSYGRLHMMAQTAKLSTTGDSIVRLDLTARGLPPDTSGEGCAAWFDLAHEWITQGFADTTARELHDKVWRRTQ